MNHGAKASGLPDLTANLLRDGGCLIDNLFADLWNQMRMKAKLKRLGFHKRSGTPSDELVFALMIWVWLKVDSIGMFARESLKTFCELMFTEHHPCLPRFAGTQRCAVCGIE
jgi:hypothetical protein